MSFPDIFKYNGLISVPLFAIISFLLIKKKTNFSFSQYTISKSILFLHNRIQRIIFRLNFLLKALLDLGFTWYIIHFFKLPFNSPVIWSLLLSSVLFGSLSYFIEGTHSTVHKIIVYSSGVLWVLSQIYLSSLTRDPLFIGLTNAMTAIFTVLTFWFMFAKKTNVFIQALCMVILYSWLAVFVFNYL